MAQLPTGTVTFLFTDIEGSTKLLHELGAEAYSTALAEHRRLLRDAFARHGGVEVDTQGDAFFVAFASASGALEAAAEAQQALAAAQIRVRMGLHTGTPHLTAEGYVGQDVHRGARIAAAGHGGQVLLSKETGQVVGDAVKLLDLGEHRLKDFDAPVWIYQLGTERFPPLKTIANTNLPRPVSSFVGREQEVADIGALLNDGARLVTLTGPGGSGKTRLAIESAAELVPDFRNGVFWVDLAPLRDSTLVGETIAQTIGAKNSLAEHIGERQMLLVLDNLEQVVAAAPELSTLLSACPNLRLLDTSRELLRVRGEVEYAVPPLAARDAVDLFVARSGVPASETIAELCRRLDNLPLAVELAAARTSVLSPSQILERISNRLDLLKGGRDADPRQQTLRATIAWSHDLLDAEEKRMFARLSVFRGGWTLESAEDIASADLDVLQSLVDKSLVQHVGERFTMLETVGEFAAERLEASGEPHDLRRRHLEFFVALADRAYDERSTSGSRWLQIMDGEVDNVRAALDWAGIGSPEREVRLAGAVAYYWSLRAQRAEARERLARGLARYGSRDGIRARALTHLGALAGTESEAFSYLNEALALWRELRDRVGEAVALDEVGYKRIALDDDHGARLAFEQSLELRTQAGTPDVEGWFALGGLCQLCISAGDIERAEPMAKTLYELGARHGNLDAQGDALHYLADCALIRREYLEAQTRYRRALDHARTYGLVGQAAEELRGVAMSLAGLGDDARAIRFAAAASAQREAVGGVPLNAHHWWAKLQERLIGAARARLPGDSVKAAETAGRNVGFDVAADEALLLAHDLRHA